MSRTNQELFCSHGAACCDMALRMVRQPGVRMRLPMFTALACLLLTPQAQAASSAPHIKLGTAYPDARRALIAQGFDPGRIVSWTGSTDHTCATGAWGG